ncbi:MAG: TIGR02646 family protein [Acidaminococcaceae bacterium]|nr:TIGR02646 family protein [Acidaminococcaceae bacterium]
MKRVQKSPEEPVLLARYKLRHPHDIWENFHHRSRDGYRQVKQQILRDQHGLCAYCEINIKLTDEEDRVDDFRVEHFYPKTGTEREECNYHLEWKNMLGVCHGGSQPLVTDARYRFSKAKEDRSCDVPKGGKSISTVILNPLQIPAKERLFSFDSFSGTMSVDEENCPEMLRNKAANTITELNLNAPRLKRLRKAVIEVLQDQVVELAGQGIPVEEAMAQLAGELLVPNSDDNYPAFFSTIRWYLGEAAENVLRERDYII